MIRARHTVTYQTRLRLDDEAAAVLDCYAELFCGVERKLFARLCAGASASQIKPDFCRRYGLTARQFNSIRITLEGKMAAARAVLPQQIEELKYRIERAQKVIKRLARRVPGSAALHNKKRRLERLRQRLDRLTEDQCAGQVRICFGGRRLFRRQFHLEENSYRGHEQWLAEWRRARANQFFVVGSGDETSGNQSCVAAVAEDGTLRLRLRLPPALENEYGRYLEIGGIRFSHGHDEIVAALESITIKTTTSRGRRVTKRIGRAISYRFLRDNKSWRLFVTVDEDLPPTATWRELGAIGIDVNSDHLAVAEVDRNGNLIAWWLIPLPLRGKTRGQRRAIILEACALVAELARERGKPVVIEQLDFARKRAEVEGVGADRSRELSSFSYSQVLDCLNRACCRRGVGVIRRSAAYTSVIGAVNYATRYGVSVHVGAACAIARRGLGFAERPAGHEARVPTRGGRHVTLSLPVRNRGASCVAVLVSCAAGVASGA